MKRNSHFKRELFHFLEDLNSNNRREWFEDNRARYEREVREPVIAFIMDFAPRLKQISSRFIADPRPIGGSMFRIYRDVRFSPDKRPYKTHAAARFPHVMSRDVHAPGFYLHLEPRKRILRCRYLASGCANVKSDPRFYGGESAALEKEHRRCAVSSTMGTQGGNAHAPAQGLQSSASTD